MRSRRAIRSITFAGCARYGGSATIPLATPCLSYLGLNYYIFLLLTGDVACNNSTLTIIFVKKNSKILVHTENCRIFASTLLCLFVWVFRALSSDKGERVFFMPKIRK